MGKMWGVMKKGIKGDVKVFCLNNGMDGIAIC